jgi:2-polyprenyl-6-methoxyphenol hydroxylase-like FAD-dependent oxidoreductase
MQGQSVLISGAGIAGPALAAWLHAADFRPVLVERSSSPRPGGYVIDFWGLGYVIAQRMGLLSEINRLGYHLRALRIVDARGKTVSGFDARVMSELTGGRFVTIARSDLARVLLDHSGASTEVIFGDEIVALQQDAGGVDVNFLHASPRRFDLVIGADGLHSGVRRSVFGPDARFEKKLGYVAAAFEISGYRPREQETYVIYAQPGRMVGRFALHEDRTLILFVLSAEQNMDLATLDLSAQKQFLRARFGADAWELPRILCELTDSTDLYFDRVSQIRMERWSSGRVALLGDAAACISLTGGQGWRWRSSRLTSWPVNWPGQRRTTPAHFTLMRIGCANSSPPNSAALSGLRRPLLQKRGPACGFVTRCYVRPPFPEWPDLA